MCLKHLFFKSLAQRLPPLTKYTENLTISLMFLNIHNANQEFFSVHQCEMRLSSFSANLHFYSQILPNIFSLVSKNLLY